MGGPSGWLGGFEGGKKALAAPLSGPVELMQIPICNKYDHPHTRPRQLQGHCDFTISMQTMQNFIIFCLKKKQIQMRSHLFIPAMFEN